MDLDIRESGNTCTIKVKGPFKSFDAVREFESAVESALATGHTFLVLDLEAMPVIDSSGIGSVVSVLRRTRQLGGDAKLVNPSPFALKTFKMVGILNLFEVFPTQEEAITASVPK
ncbi:MAG TPA: STAS domain-containing protein [Terracidiphilus sp.]|nr:STAS domain-containing protein [Terracidiphilus sp.]